MTIKSLKNKQMEQPNKVKGIGMKEASLAYNILREVAGGASWELPLEKYVGKSEENRDSPFLYFDGMSAMSSGIALPNSLNYYDIFDRITLPTILKFIEPKEQRSLLNLLDSFLKVWDCWDKDNLEFKVKEVTPSNLIKNGRSICFTDNLDGLTSYFAPTVEHINKIAEKVTNFYGQRVSSLENILDDSDKKIAPANSVVYNWHTYTTSSFDAWSYAFKPLVTLNPKGYEMHVKNKKDFEKGISDFKERFKTTYIPCAYSPIILAVNSIISNGYKKFLEEKDDKANRKRLAELDLVKGKSY